MYDLGRNDEAIALLKQSAARAHRLRDTHAEIDAWRYLSSAQIDAGDVASAIASAHAAIDALPPNRPTSERRALLDAMQAHGSLANAMNQDRKPGVVAEARTALRYAAQMGGTLARVAAIDDRVLLGVGLVGEGQPAEGLRELQSAFADSRQFHGADHRQTDIIASLLGTASIEAGDVAGALLAYQSAYDSSMRHEAARGPYAIAFVHYQLACALAANHDPAHALPHFEAAAQLFSQAGGPVAPLALRSRSQHALSLARLGRLADADREFDMLATAPFPGIDKAAHAGRLAVLRGLEGRHREAVTLAQASADAMQAFPAKLPRAQSLARLGSILLAGNHPEQAIAPLEQSVTLLRQIQLPESPEIADALAALQRARGMTR